MRNKKLVAGVVPSLWAAAALLLTASLIAEIAAVPTSAPGITSSVWTPITSVTALFLGADSIHGSFNLPSVLFGLGVILLTSVLAGSLATAFITYCLGEAPHLAASALLGAAVGLATEILLINLLANWLQSDNGIYTSLPSWAWFPAFAAWGATLGLFLSHRSRSASSAMPAPAPSRTPRMKPIDTRNQFFDVWNVYWPIALAVFLIILGTVLFLGFRYRSHSHEIPSGKDESQPLEIGYAIGLACIAAFLVFLTFSRMPGSEDANATGKPVDLRVTAARWNWRFEYPETGYVEQGTKEHVPVLRVPVHTPIDFTGSSLDVIHSFFVPEERFKRDVFPGQHTHWEMVFEAVGNHLGGGECAEFCGLEHGNMNFDVLVMPKAAFARWEQEAS